MNPITNRRQWNCFASPSLRLITPIYFCGQSVANLIGNNDIITCTTSYKNLPLNIMMSSQFIMMLPLQIIKLLLKIKDMPIHINMSCDVPNNFFLSAFGISLLFRGLRENLLEIKNEKIKRQYVDL